MLSFVARAFRVVNVILCWLVLIGVPFIVAYYFGYNGGGGAAVLGFILGGIVGLIVVILFGGLIANFLDMVDNLEAIRNHLSYSSGGNLSGANLSNVTAINPTQANSGEIWVCKKCNTQNNITASFCRDCGAPK